MLRALHSRFEFVADSAPGRMSGAAEPCQISAYAKTSSVDRPFIVPNEYICNRLAMAIGLPVGEGGLATTEGERRSFYVSHEVDLESPIPLNREVLDSLVKDSREMADVFTRVAVFDCWVVNKDRHDWNVLVDPFGAGGFHVIDHAEALYVGVNSAAAQERLESQDGVNWKDGASFQKLLSRKAAVERAVESIRALPAAFVEAACAGAVASGFDEAFEVEDARWCANFLLERREQLMTLLTEV